MNKIIKPKYGRGMLFAIGGPLAGIALSIALWEVGFIAGLASFALAWLTVYLYQKGAGNVDRKSIYIILAYIAVGLVLSILSLIVDDGLHAALNQYKDVSVKSMLTRADFWNYIGNNLLHNGSLWSNYATTILMAVAFSIWGAYGVVKDLITSAKQ